VRTWTVTGATRTIAMVVSPSRGGFVVSRGHLRLRTSVRLRRH
jgi:hypothetical protein